VEAGDPNLTLRAIDWIELSLSALGLLAIFMVYRAARTQRLVFNPVERDDNLALESIIPPVLVFLMTIVVVAGAWGTPPQETDLAESAVTTTLAQVAGALTCLAVAHRAFRGGVRRFLWSPGQIRPDITWGLVGLLISVPMCWGTAQLSVRVLQFFSPEYSIPLHTVLQMLADEDPPAWLIAWLWVGASIVAPVAEEVFFRGIIQTALVRWTRRRGLAVFITAVMFGAAHASQPHAIVPLAILGGILGLLYEFRGALIAPITLHVLFNLKTLIASTWLMPPS
jgi:membrane protease YdiL (CAAX protease family)